MDYSHGLQKILVSQCRIACKDHIKARPRQIPLKSSFSHLSTRDCGREKTS